jgi:hypothetical protein
VKHCRVHKAFYLRDYSSTQLILYQNLPEKKGIAQLATSPLCPEIPHLGHNYLISPAFSTKKSQHKHKWEIYIISQF